MGRLAFLPDTAVLSDLLARMRAEPSDKPLHGNRGAPAPSVASEPAHGSAAPSRLGLAPTRDPLLDLRARLEPRSTLDARFESFVAWLQAETGARAVFVADAEGLSMVQSETGDGYLVAAGEISMVLDNLKTLLPEVDQGSTLLRLKRQGNVELVWSKTHLGRFTVGLVIQEPLAQEFVSIIKAGLAMVTAQVTER